MPDHEHRAGKLWPILIEAAELRDGLTYRAAADRLGIHWRPMRYALDPIQRYCLDEGLPRLTALVYAQATGLPGAGFAGVPGDLSDLQEVYDFDWQGIENPFSDRSREEIGSISDELLADPTTAPDKWAQILSRGNLQRVFRRAILKAYNYRCAICQLAFEELLEAAHIIPWASQRRELRADPRNGVCLCANHHRLFDSGWLSITPSYRVLYADPEMSEGNYTQGDKQATIKFHNQKIKLPDDKRLYPSKDLLARRSGG